uniref:Uncharacterized protein n=1 Tax=Musa acuminata subsp. malaccensis TaxID=214687 RepID=A0A804KBU0_MUSAM
MGSSSFAHDRHLWAADSATSLTHELHKFSHENNSFLQ